MGIIEDARDEPEDGGDRGGHDSGEQVEAADRTVDLPMRTDRRDELERPSTRAMNAAKTCTTRTAKWASPVTSSRLLSMSRSR